MNKCPSCKQKIASADNVEWLPFCSERCKLIDLGAWLNENHRIPAETVDITELHEDKDYTTH